MGNVVDPTTGISTLMRAAELGYWRLCQLLIGHGADCNAESIGGATALSLAIYSGMSCRRPCCGGHLRAPRLLLRHTQKGLPEALVSATRMALQDDMYLPLIDELAVASGSTFDIDQDVD